LPTPSKKRIHIWRKYAISVGSRWKITAVVRDPVRVEEIDPPLLGVDAVLREDERLAGAVLEQRAEQARVAVEIVW
jgi:hypothetical protein